MIKKIIVIFLALFTTTLIGKELNLDKITFINKIDYSIKLFNVKKRLPLYEKDIQQKFIPASLTKLVLTSAILDAITTKFRFKTPVYIDNLKPPNLYIKGSGDPNISRKQFQILSQKLKKRNISHINNVVLDDSVVIKDVNSNGESARYYYALSGGLNTNFNQIKLQINSTYTMLIASPNSSFIKIDLRNVIFDKKEKLPQHPKITILKRTNSDRFIVNGTISNADELNNNLKLRISRPTLFFQSELEKVLSLNDITIVTPYSTVKKTHYKKKKIYTIVSEPISTTLIKLNQESDNMIGNLLFKYLGKTRYREPGTIKKGRNAIEDFVEEELQEGANVKILEGAGLSKYSTITTEFINNVLIYLYKKHFKLIKQCLINISQASEYNLITIPKNYKVYVKSGTLAQIGVNNLAGFIENTQTKEIYSFTILTKTKHKKHNPVYKGNHTIPILNELLNQFFI